MTKEEQYVWYASFGSNLFYDRFRCYITGGVPEGSNRCEVGSRDPSLPIDDKAVSLPFELYFAGYSDRWDGGAAFIDTVQDLANKSWARMYLITVEQFEDVVRQENGMDDLQVDIHSIIEKGNMVLRQSPYGNLIHAGYEDGRPIFTFTSPYSMTEREITKPSERYLAMLIRGYWQVHTQNALEITNYLMNKRGMREFYSYDDVLALVNEQKELAQP
ncbi:hypothetical protein [Pontibacillus litoralis]|uniref:Histone deacetylase n=1 Tax=Pontibacillus litoralis JSM 072002 TaxID=1385512 RepID=A0A0A5G575_9BACI|nr:hypothetical protein [Pontibacillus litoralis]KGX87199.1 histone deacetylase [Pontibacillus litoralis JSM 072002]